MRDRRIRDTVVKLRVVPFLLCWLVGAPPILNAQSGGVFAKCQESFRLRPDEPESSTCFYLAAQPGKRWEEAAALLESLKKDNPDNFWLELTLGHLDLVQGKAGAEQHYRSAADGFATTGNPSGEVLALANLRNQLQRRGQTEEAGLVVKRAVDVAASSGDSTVVARAGALEATHIIETGGDLGAALLSVRQAVDAAFPEGSYGLKRQCLLILARICTRLGRYQEARAAYTRLSVLMQEANDHFEEPTVLSNMANLRLRELEELADPGKLPEVTDLANQALEKALKVGNGSAQALSHRLLAEILGVRDNGGQAARQHLDACFQAAEKFKTKEGLIACLWTASQIFSDSDPGQSRKWLEQAIELAIETDSPQDLAYAWRARMMIGWKELPPRDALAVSLRALSAIEALRDGQGDESGSVGVFSQWARDYQWLVGSLLGETGDNDRWALVEAFSISERMRARYLLDRLASSRLPSKLPKTHPLVQRRLETNQKMVAVQRELLSPELDSASRKNALERLGHLEVDYQEVLAELRKASPDEALRDPMFTGLEAVERQLGANEALLSFQVGQWKDVLGRFAGGAWLLLSTHEGSRAFRLPDRKRLREVVPVFLGLLQRRDGQDVEGAAQLYRELLAPALASLPKAIDHLILLPDDILHHLPFGALRSAPNAAPLAQNFELTISPSATLWSHWRSERVEAHPVSGLVLADPELPYMSRDGSLERGWPIAVGTRLGPLPFARREGRDTQRRLGEGSMLRVGPQASEKFVKGSDLSAYAVLHLAAHAVVDEDTPYRSAVLLAPGSEDEDGLWQVREIIDANLAGQLVVLSACQTASGAVLSGEGVVGLSRAFFQAGAHTVIGSLWPLRDDEAARFFERFYRYLGRGESVAAAMRHTQSEAMADGLPAAAWSGLVVLGEGSLIPFPGGVAPSETWFSAPWLAALLLVVLALALWLRFAS